MPSDSTSPKTCPTCGATLDPSLIGGGCVACLWGDIIAGEKDEASSTSDTPHIVGYDILEEIGRGGMGVVYRALQHTPAREVALKIIAPYSLRASEARKRFLLEIDAMAAVEHPTLLPLYDAGEDKHGRPWLTMQLANGGTLLDRIETYSSDWKKIAHLLICLSRAIHYAHERGILHRDLKPANILFDEENNPYIADFGLAKWADEDISISRSNMLLGSPAYLAPEAVEGGSKLTTTVSDVYGLGAILYELLCGKKPYEGTQAAEILTQILTRPVISPRLCLASIPRDLEVIVLKSMAYEPSKRYQSAADLADDLSRWLDGKPILARPVSKLERVWIWAKRNPLSATLSFLLISSLLTAGFLLWQSNKELTIALNDAEDRVDFMTRELPVSLEPLGRLELLDAVFENTSKHYEQNKRTDPNSLSRHADFLTQWSQILRPRGQIKESLIRLNAAMEKAIAATAKKNFPLEAARSRISTGQRLGEALIEDQNYHRARTTLNETLEFSDQLPKKYLQDLRLADLIAQLILEQAVLEHKQGNQSAALAKGKEAIKKWQILVPRLLKKPDSPHHQKSLINVAKAHYFLFRIHQANGDKAGESRQIKLYLDALKKFIRTSPGNLIYQHELQIAGQLYTSHLLATDAITLDEGKQRFIQLDHDIVELTAQAPGNIRWRTDSMANALRLAEIAEQQHDDEAKKLWMNVISQRLNILYKMYTTYIRVLIVHRRAASLCGAYYENRDWSLARHHLNASFDIHRQICRLTPTLKEHQLLQQATCTYSDSISKHENPQAAIKWLKNQIEINRKESRKSKLPILWLWSEAACYRCIAKLNISSDSRVDANNQCLGILLTHADKAQLIPSYPDNVLKTATDLLTDNNTTTDIRISSLKQLLSALHHLRKPHNPERDKKWLDLLIQVIPKIPVASRQTIIDLAQQEFFADKNNYSQLYLQLQRLR